MACEYSPCVKYRSDSSDQASASVGEKSRSCTRADAASETRPMDRRRAIRRFVIGCNHRNELLANLRSKNSWQTVMTHDIGAISFQNSVVLFENRFQLSIALGLSLRHQAP